jgi:hypothetical protein
VSGVAASAGSPARSRAWGTAFRVLAALIALYLLAFALGRIFHTRGGPASSSFATVPAGLAAYSELLTRSGHPVTAIRAGLDSAELGPATTVVVLDADAVAPSDAAALRRFVTAGGRLVAGGSEPGWLRELDPDVPDWTPAAVPQARPLDSGSPLTAGVRRLRSDGPGSWRRSRRARAVVGARGRSLLSEMKIGRGRVELLASASPLQNRLLASADNPVLGVNLAGGRGRPVAFAESVHGYGERTGLAALPREWKWALIGLGIAGLTAIAARFRRLGPPEDESRELPPPRREYVEAIATALMRTRRWDEAVAPVRAAALDRLTRRSSIGDDPDRTALRDAGRRLGLTEPELDALFEEAADESTMLAAGRALAKLSKEAV